MKFKCTECGHRNEVNVGAILGSRTSEAKREAARANASAPPKPGSRPRGNPGSWNAEEIAIINKIIEQYDGRPTRAYKAHPEWKKKLLKDHTGGALYAKIQYLKRNAPAPNPPGPLLITPPLPPPPSSDEGSPRADRRNRRGAGAPKANDLS